MQESSSNGMALKAVNQSVDEIRERNRTLERDLLNIIKLFYLYQRHIEHKIEKARNANEMALEFLTVLGEQVDGVRKLVEDSEFMGESATGSAKKQSHSDEKSAKDRKDRYADQSHSSWRKKFTKKSAEDATSVKIIKDINGNKDQMMKEIQESQSSLNFILDYLRRLNFCKDSSQNLGSSQHSDSSKSLRSNMNAENILGLADVDEFLIKTSHFFSGHKNTGDSDKGVKAYLVRIADLQKELKRKDEDILELSARLEGLESHCQQEVAQLTGSFRSSRGKQEPFGTAGWPRLKASVGSVVSQRIAYREGFPSD